MEWRHEIYPQSLDHYLPSLWDQWDCLYLSSWINLQQACQFVSSSADFFSPKLTFSKKKKNSGIPFRVSNSLDLYILLGLVWVQSVCKGYQQMQRLSAEETSRWRVNSSSPFCHLLITFAASFGTRSGLAFSLTERRVWFGSKTVWHSNGIPERIFRKSWFWKIKQQTTKKNQEKISQEAKSKRVLTIIFLTGRGTTRNDHQICTGISGNLFLGEENAVQCLLSSSWLRGLSASTGGYSVKLLAQGSISIYRWVFCQALGSGVYQHLQVGILSSSWLRGLSASTGGYSVKLLAQGSISIYRWVVCKTLGSGVYQHLQVGSQEK